MKLVYALTTDGDWDVHAAGCADLRKRATKARFNGAPIPFEADTFSEMYAHVLDSETRELGYSEEHVSLLPCADIRDDTRPTYSARLIALVEYVQRYASEHYSDGWGFVVEAMTFDDIAETIGSARSESGALKKMNGLVKLRAEQGANVEASNVVELSSRRASKNTSERIGKLSTDRTDLPSDPAELRQMLKITRDRRWRAGRRDDDALVEQMNAKLAALTAKLAQVTK